MVAILIPPTKIVVANDQIIKWSILDVSCSKRLVVSVCICSKRLSIEPIVSVVIINPYNDKEFLDDKLSIVDVKANDQSGRIFQIEVQLAYYTDLPARMLYTWGDIYCKQLKSGNDFTNLKPTYSIWLMGKNAIKDDDKYVHAYKLRDETGKLLTDHGGIWLLELEKFSAVHVENEQERWLKFLALYGFQGLFVKLDEWKIHF